jgi:phosphatidylglycerophosphatase C
VVFDFDHTLYDGDSGSHLFAWLIRRSWWRRLLALADAAGVPAAGGVPADTTLRRQCLRVGGYGRVPSLDAISTR